MRTRLVFSLLALLLLLSAAAGVVIKVVSRPIPPGDVVAANDIALITRDAWPDLDIDAYPNSLDFAVVDATGQPVLSRGIAYVDVYDAVRERWPSLPVHVDGEIVATVVIADSLNDEVQVHNRTILGTVSGVFSAIALALVAWTLWLWRSVLRPFQRLDEFATDVAAGNLNAPLDMDKRNAFGSFTEAFDVMRTELAQSREREAELAESKRTLVSQLSHDIRTPVASIGATAELLHLTEKDPTRIAKLDTVQAKVTQVTELLDDLFKASAEEMTDIPVTNSDHNSQEIADIVRKADTSEAVTQMELPAVLVCYDPLRLQQVVDNILANAAKYAGTPVSVTGQVAGTYVRILFTDSGDGVPEDEIDLITHKRVRGSNSAGLPGFGLGLYTSAWLMEQMGGDLQVRNVDGGFQVQLDIPLAN
ncbi:MAG: HAMP domain-containing histidine kinase [Actinomycetaceae bacterium]|nr:HAMP domain-containing histidine kinase [Actinomycetaceae bacterium]